MLCGRRTRARLRKMSDDELIRFGKAARSLCRDPRPLIERKKRLARLVRGAKCPRLLYAQHVEQHGKGLFAEIGARDLEGIVAKRKLGIYKDDGNSWLKMKNRTYSQAEGRHELLTRGR
jgi:ATP-dependent DNA ligase